MKSKFLIIVFLFATLFGFSQADNSMSYQAIVRGANGNLLVNSPVSFRFSVIESETDDTPIYQETQIVTTNENGLATLRIGNGTATIGSTTNLIVYHDWSYSSYWLKTEIDPTGGTNYTLSDTKKFSGVPYAFGAHKSRLSQSVTNLSVDTNQFSGNGYTTPLTLGSQGATTGQVLKFNGTSWAPANDISDQIWTSYSSNAFWNTNNTYRIGFGTGFSSALLPSGFHFRNPMAYMTLEGYDGNSILTIKSKEDYQSMISYYWGNNLKWATGLNWDGRYYIGRNNSSDFTILSNGFIGMGTVSPANKLSLVGNANITGNLGIGISAVPTFPLSFPAAIGNKILLYPGGSGYAGLGVYSNEVRLHSDNINSRVSFGWQDNSGNFIEFGRFHKYNNEALAIQGNLWANGTVYSSDERFKKNIIPITDALTKLQQINGVEYEMNIEAFKEKNFAKGRQMGFLAQNVEKVVPEAVSENEDGYKGVDYARLVPLLLESIKEQQKQIEALEKKIEVLEGK